MTGLNEQIAVLDGLDALDPNDGRIGQQRARVDQYATPVMPGVTARSHVLDASAGANYSGGSSYAAGLPLMPSSVGLAGCVGCGPHLGAIPSVLPTRKHVIDYSGGAQYSGGSSWVPGLPLVPSSAGLAADFIRGGYGRAGLGADFIRGGYGRAGLGQTASAVDEDLAGAMEAVETAKALNPADGRIGQSRANVDEYGKPIMPGVLARSNVLDPSEGANYSGGSDYAPGLPLGPSSWGLAGLGELGTYDGLDGLSQVQLPIALPLRKFASRGKVKALKSQARKTARRIAKVRLTPMARAKEQARLQRIGAQLTTARRIRRATLSRMRYAQRVPLWAR